MVLEQIFWTETSTVYIVYRTEVLGPIMGLETEDQKFGVRNSGKKLLDQNFWARVPGESTSFVKDRCVAIVKNFGLTTMREKDNDDINYSNRFVIN